MYKGGNAQEIGEKTCKSNQQRRMKKNLTNFSWFSLCIYFFFLLNSVSRLRNGDCVWIERRVIIRKEKKNVYTEKTLSQFFIWIIFCLLHFSYKVFNSFFFFSCFKKTWWQLLKYRKGLHGIDHALGYWVKYASFIVIILRRWLIIIELKYTS